MANLTINIPDEKVNEVVNTLSSAFGYAEMIQNDADPEGPKIANPESKAAFVKRKIVQYLKLTYKKEKQKQERLALTVLEDAENYFLDVD